MSTTILQPSVFVPPAGIVLPPNAEPEYAFTDTLPLTPTTFVSQYTHTTPAIYFEIITQIYGTMGAVGGTAKRVLLVVMTDVNGRIVYQVAAPALVNTGYMSYMNWVATALSAYALDDTADGLFQVAPLPLILMLPGWTLTLKIDDNLPGDIWLTTSVTITHIPTGAIQEPLDTSLVATPLVL